MTGLLLSLLLAGTSPNPNLNPALKTIAKEGRPQVGLDVTVVQGLAKNGVSESEVRTQVEAAMRRCGLSIWSKGQPPTSRPIWAAVSVGGFDLEFGFAGSVAVELRALSTVEGFEGVLLDAYTQARHFKGPPGGAGVQLRDALARLLDDLCNQYLQAREEVGAK